jgi:predicted XRE-type DNA-binding protein
MSCIYNICVDEVQNYNDKDVYISDLAMSSIWGDPIDADIPEERLIMLGNIYDAASRSIKDIIKEAGLSQKKLAERFGIPYRTVQNWCGEINQCPLYTKLMIQEILGIFNTKYLSTFL